MLFYLCIIVLHQFYLYYLDPEYVHSVEIYTKMFNEEKKVGAWERDWDHFRQVFMLK